MPDFFNRHRQFTGNLLVAMQFGVLLLLGLMAAPRVWRGEVPEMSLALAGLSAALGVWTLGHNRLGNFNIHPVPKTAGTLVTSGPYRLIRHPMYSAVLLLAAAMAWLVTPWVSVSAWCLLARVLWTKATLEERWMSEQHPGYAAYCQQTRRFVPWLL